MVEQISNKEEKTTNIYLFKNVSNIDKSNFYDYLSVMVDGGVTLVKALDSVVLRVKNSYFRLKIKELKVYISSGDSLSKSMKKISGVFDQGEISIIEAGEKSGTLVESLSVLSEDLKNVHNLKNNIKSAMTYPIIIILFLILAVFIVMTYVIPAIKPMFAEAQAELPLATTMLIATSDFISGNISAIILFVVIFFLVLYGYKTTESGKETFDRLILKTPLVGPVYKNYILAHIASTLGTLFTSGVPVIRSLNLVGTSTNNLLYEKVFQEITTSVSKGSKIVDSMLEVDKQNEYFTPDFIQMLSVGEKTATIGKVTKKINKQYTREVDSSLAILTKWIEPLAILVAGVFVLWFAFAIFGAILELTQSVG